MKMHSQVEYKQEVNGLVRRHPYPQQQRRIRVLGPKQHCTSSPESDVQSSDSTVPEFGGGRYCANLEGAREHVLEPDEFGLVWGVMHEMPDDDGEFKMRLLQRASGTTKTQEQEQSHLEEQRPMKCVEVSRESLDLLCFHEPKIRSLMLAHDKALIFQNMDVQVYVMEELKEEGFRVHFEDKKRTKVSLTYQQFLSFVSALPRLERDYMKYKKKLKMKKNKVRTKGTTVGV